MPVKFEKDWPKTVGGVAGRRYILPIHFCSIRARKKSVKNEKNVVKNNFRIQKKQYAYLQTILKAPVKFNKRTMMVLYRSPDHRFAYLLLKIQPSSLL